MSKSSPPPLGRLIVGWLFVLLCVIGLGVVAWKGFGFSRNVRIGAGGLAVLIFLAQQLLSRWDAGGVVRAILAAAMAGGAVAATLQWVPAAQLYEDPAAAEGQGDKGQGDKGQGDKGQGDKGQGDKGKAGASASKKPDPPAPGEADYTKLPHAAGYACRDDVRTDASLAKLKSSFSASDWRKSMFAALEIRYPSAHKSLKKLRDPNHFDVWFQPSDRGSFGAAINALPTAVHEGMHMVDIMQHRGNAWTYELSDKKRLTPTVPKTFNRDQLVDHLPEAVKAMNYTKTYLTGKSGAQGFELVLEEQNAYTYSMLSAVAFADQLPSGRSNSSRDGLMTFIYYVEAYLKLAREKYPKDYALMLAAPGLKKAIVTLNDRAECALSLSAGNSQLGIHDADLWPHVFGDKKLGEIDRLR